MERRARSAAALGISGTIWELRQVEGTRAVAERSLWAFGRVERTYQAKIGAFAQD